MWALSPDAAGNPMMSRRLLLMACLFASSVALAVPYKGPTYSGVIPIMVNATDDVGVVRVEILVNDSLVAIMNVPPYTANWDSNTVPNGIVKLTAKAYDAAGNVGSSQIVWLKIRNR